MKKREREQHGMSKTPTYHSWAMMNQRCRNERNAAFNRYGGRSIAVCDRWQSSFLAFLEDMGEKPEGMTLDRIDNDGDYCRDNCRWATPTEQANNTRRTRYVIVDGKKVPAKTVAKENGVTSASVASRLNAGWSIEQAVGLEDHHPDSAITINGETLVMAQWAAKLGISRQAVGRRIKTGWDVKKALTTPKTDFSLTRGIPKGPRAKMRSNQLGQLITNARLNRELTQRQLSDCSAVSASVICMIETGRLPNPKRYIIESLADALDIQTKEIDDLLPETSIDTIQYKWYDEWVKGDTQMSNDEKERPTWLQVRMSDQEKALLTELSEEYRLSISAFVRMMISHFDDKRPTVAVRFGPKAEAVAVELDKVAV